MNSIEKVHVLNLISGETVVGCNCIEYDERVQLEFPALLIKDNKMSVYLSLFFGKPEKVLIETRAIIHRYEITDQELVQAYNKSVSKSVIRVVDNKIYVPQ